jgi:hypothetical protein
VAGNGENLAAEFHGQSRRDQGTRILRAFDNDNSERHIRDDRLRRGKVCGAANVPMGNSPMIAPRCSICSKISILLRIDHIDAAAKDANRAPSRRTSARLCGRWHRSHERDRSK